MTEDDARRVLLLQAVETGAPATSWTAEDRRWATRQAAAAVGEDATPERFAVARAGLAMQRLLPRERGAERWLARRGWHPAWVGLALLAGFVAGVAADQLGAPQRVNLLAPAVWAVVAWNLVVYAALLFPLPQLGLRDALARLGLRGPGARHADHADSAGALWAQHAAPLMTDRAALVLHSAAAALGAGLVAGLYLRGLVLDYRAGWQSTFLDAAAVQQGLDWLLAPASRLTGIAVPDVAPLRVAPGADAMASAAPWIHLYAATLGMAVLLPRALLALRAGARARWRSRHFRLPLDTPYFEGLHPLMRPGLPRVLRLLWLSDLPRAVVFGTPVGPAPAAGAGPVTVLRSDEGDELQLLPAPAAPPPGAAPGRGWAGWLRAAPVDPLPGLREQVSAVLRVAAAPRSEATANGQGSGRGNGPANGPGNDPPGGGTAGRSNGAPPAWLAGFGRPVVVLRAGAAASGADTLALDDLADGWLADGRLLHALSAVLDDDPRWRRLAAAWTARQAARFDAVVTELAATLAGLACDREPLADDGALLSRRGDAEAARGQLLQRVDAALLAHDARLSALLARGPVGPAGDGPGLDTGDAALAGASAVAGAGTGAGAAHATDVANAADVEHAAVLRTRMGDASLHARVGEGRAAMVGGVLSGALAGLKADLLSGGLTMGAGAVAGGVIGALGAAGAARGLNVVRGTDRSFVAWDAAALAPLTQALLVRGLVRAHGLAPDDAQARLAPALATQQGAIDTLWRSRGKGADPAGEAAALAAALHRPLADALVQALGGPGHPRA